jgi:hypothetical protein
VQSARPLDGVRVAATMQQWPHQQQSLLALLQCCGLTTAQLTITHLDNEADLPRSVRCPAVMSAASKLPCSWAWGAILLSGTTTDCWHHSGIDQQQ